MADLTIERLGIITCGCITLQTDAMFSLYETKLYCDIAEAIDSIKGNREKLKYAKSHSISTSKDSAKGTFIISYTGKSEIGELSDYIEGFYPIVNGHQLIEITAFADKIFLCYMQVTKTRKYINAFLKVLEEEHIPYRIRGPFKKNLPHHALP